MSGKAMSGLKVCTRCVLPETFPGIRFDEAGVCNFCLEHQDKGDQAGRKAAYRENFEALVREHRGTGTYDALMCYSGGKDSTYTLVVLREQYGLNILAVSVDNGFVSPQARKNIQVVVERLGVDHIFFKPRYDTMVKLFRCCAERDIFPPTALEKASSICTACMAIVKYGTLRMALEKDIPFIAYGWSPGQAPVTSSIIKNSAGMTKFVQKALYDPLFRVAGDEITPYFLEERHFTGPYRFPCYVHPLAFLEYNEEKIYREIEELGWEPPGDVDANSTNCLLNSFGNFVHQRRLGFHPYAYELANLVRDGYLDRDEALARLNQADDPEALAKVMAKLAIADDADIAW
jgi:tRNA(Ile)-lysidine synthase TilS/MesJ